VSSTGVRKESNSDNRIIRGQIDNEKLFVESLKPFTSSSISGIGGSGGSSQVGGSGSTILTDLGTFSGAKVIDFQIYDDRSLVGNVDGDTQITFINIPFLLLLSLRLYIRSTDPIITIAGQIISGVGSSPLITTAIGDFLDISLASDDQITIQILSVKKNDESGGDVAPTLPQNVATLNHSDTSIDISWDPPAIGTLPLTYDVEYSLSPA